jgi:flagellar protein FliS
MSLILIVINGIFRIDSSIFAQVLQASQSASKPKFEHAVDCVRNVRDAWRQVAKDPEVNPAPQQFAGLSSPHASDEFADENYATQSAAGSRWNA